MTMTASEDEGSRKCSSSRRRALILAACSSVVAATSSSSTSSSLIFPNQRTSSAANAAPMEAIGGGADVRIPLSPSVPDAVHPDALLGVWQCRRAVVSVQGNVDQAVQVGRALSGGGVDESYLKPPQQQQSPRIECYQTRFVSAPGAGGTVRDRGFELASRSGLSSANVQWSPESPNVLTYDSAEKNSAVMELAVIQRSSSSSSNNMNESDAAKSGTTFGSSELVRITELNKAFGTVRCARVQQRYRLLLAQENNSAIVEGLEMVQTYRVLDGVAGVEFPTSTTQSRIQMVRINNI